MRLHCARSRKRDCHGVLKNGPPLSSLHVISILQDYPKFSGVKVLAIKAGASDVDEESASRNLNQKAPDGLPVSNTEQTGRARPRGIKKEKQTVEMKVKMMDYRKWPLQCEIRFP